jgi:hypothetical protein
MALGTIGRVLLFDGAPDPPFSSVYSEISPPLAYRHAWSPYLPRAMTIEEWEGAEEERKREEEDRKRVEEEWKREWKREEEEWKRNIENRRRREEEERRREEEERERVEEMKREEEERKKGKMCERRAQLAILLAVLSFSASVGQCLSQNFRSLCMCPEIISSRIVMN